MSSFLIDRNSPIRSVNDLPSTRLHHRSRHSTESDSGDSPLKKPQFQAPPPPTPSQTPTAKDEKEHHHVPRQKESDNLKGPSMYSYFRSELTRSYRVEDDASEFVQRRDRIYMSVNTPKNLEKFCAFGLLQCLDSILNVMTFLPLRMLVCLFHVLTYPCSVIFFRKKAILNPAQICDVLKGVVLIVSCFITSYIDTSMVYHIVRTQSTIKFYVIYNMLDVMDKLISGFGQDVLDSLYWTAVEPRGRKREHFGTIFHLMFAIAYVVIHTALILIQAITLNVAFNSHNKNLLTIILSNNFIEIKANLFKRLDKNTLCQITYFDVKERFHYFVLLLFILIHNLLEKNWLRDQASIYLVDAMIVLVVEVIVDWIKHSFINKINEFSPSFYNDFAIGLAQDIASSQNKHAFTDFSDQVCRRMGFTPIPLICLLYMVCRKSFEISGLMSWVIVFMFFLCLFTTKVLNSIVLLGWAQYLITQGEKVAKSNVTVGNSQVMHKKENKKPVTKRVKTESISHCPDMTSQLSHPVLTQHYPTTQSESKPCLQSQSPSHSAYPLAQTHQSFISPLSATNSDTEVFVKSNSSSQTEDDESVVGGISNDRLGSEENGKIQPDIDLLDSEIFYCKEVDVSTCEEGLYDKQGFDDKGDDLYNLLLQDVSGSSVPLLDDSGMSLSSPSTGLSSISEFKELSSPPQSPEMPTDPFMLKLSSNSPPVNHQGVGSHSSPSSISDLSLNSTPVSAATALFSPSAGLSNDDTLTVIPNSSELAKAGDVDGCYLPDKHPDSSS